MDVTLRDERMRELQRSYLDFLDDTADQDVYAQKVRDMIQQNESRLVLNLNDLRRKLPSRCQLLLNNSNEEILALHKALKEFVTNIDPAFSRSVGEFFVGFEGSFGSNHVTPRTLSARFLGKLICIEGIVTKCSLVRPKVVKSVHYCPATQKTIERRYTDMTSLDAFPSSSAYPTKDEDGNPLETEYGLSTYKDHQTVTIQEMPEKAPPGQLPRSVEIVCDNDLVDRCKPGDRILAVGVYRCLPSKQQGVTNGNFRAILLCNNVKVMSKEMKPVFLAEDLSKIRRFARGQKKVDLFEELAHSLAPTIHGHEYVKQALLCMLLGGVEKTLENGTRLRGDINILLIGDPGVAKSQLLRYVLNTAPRAIPTTGRGSTGVGLTAAVTVDPETGDKRLEAGAMVLADRGIVCIDEFDKMSDMDRTAIHEVMEQGRVSIAKVGIHAQLNARCSVLAAANPIYGRYDQYKTPMENIGLQDSLLSRFDVLFVLLDEMQPERDASIADHVLRIHRYRPADQQDGQVLPFAGGVDALTTEQLNQDSGEDLTDCDIYDKHDNMLHGPKDKAGKRMVSMQFMRKYIQFAKSISPVLTKESRDLISEEYVKLRAEDVYNKDTQTARTQPVTVRTLETLIRLSTAHARARLSKYVEAQDAEASIKLIEYAFFKKVLERKRPTREPHLEDDDDSGHESETEEVINPDATTKSNRKRSRKSNLDDEEDPTQGQDSSAASTGTATQSSADVTAGSAAKKQKSSSDDPFDIDAMEDAPAPPPPTSQRKKRAKEQTTTSSSSAAAALSSATSVPFDEAKYGKFKKAMSSVFYSQRTQEMGLEQLHKSVNDVTDSPGELSRAEVLLFLEKMQEANQIMMADDMVYLI